MTLNPVEGEIFVVDKPLGWSSFHVVKKLRGALTSRLRRFGVRKLKVGHAGTLDPLASGVMIVCTGKATKQIDELQAGVKEYIAEIKLGATTPSFDLETAIDAVFPTGHITRELVKEVLRKFTGRIDQIPPSYSACKIDGHRAYKMARKGVEVELHPKTLVIDEVELLDFSPEQITIRVVCSKGTYIRALARDIGAALGSGGHLTALRRTRVGAALICRALPISEILRHIHQSPMTFTDEEGDLLDVPPTDFNPEDICNEKADIKPFSER